MTFTHNLKRLAQRVPVVRALSGSSHSVVAAQQARLAHHDQALQDLTSAVQSLQAALPTQVLELQLRLDLIEAHLPDLLNTIASAHGTQRAMTRRVAELAAAQENQGTSIENQGTSMGQAAEAQWQRIEMIRRELMFELRYSDRAGQRVAAETKVINAEKLSHALAEGLRLNLGCGHIALEEYINIDARVLPGVDVIADVDNLPVEAGQAAEVFSAHLVEHFPQEEFERHILPYWISLLRPSGELRAVVPDAGAMLAAHGEGKFSYSDLREVLYGGQEYEGDFHFNMYTTESLGAILAEAGLIDIKVEAEGRVNGACLEFQIVARKPALD